MIKPDFSKAAMSKFFLLHTEKLILGVSAILLGVFFWMGFKAKPFTETTPDKLVDMADRAGQYIRSDTAWDAIKPFRNGAKDVDITILNNSGVDPTMFNIDPITGIVAATLEPRTDPELFKILFPEARQFRAPAIVAINGNIEQFVDYPSAGGTGPMMGGAAGGRGGIGMGGIGGIGGMDEDMGEEEDGDEFDDGGLGGFGGDFGGGGRGGLAGGGRNSRDKKEETPIPELEYFGKQMKPVNVHTSVGIRPTQHGIQASSSKAFVYDFVAVTALVDYKTQWKAFNDIFSTGIGFYPDRDKPIYEFLEIQRREIGADGTPGKWVDQSEMATFNVPSAYPRMHQLPKAMHSTAPDIVAPENFDPVLSTPIPPVVMFDYRPYVTHSKLVKNREFPKIEIEDEVEDLGAFDIFNPGGGAPAFGGGRSTGGRNMGAPGGGGRAMGAPGGGGRTMGAPGGGGRAMGAPGGGRGAPGGAPGGIGGRGAPGGMAGMGGGGQGAPGGLGMGGAGGIGGRGAPGGGMMGGGGRMGGGGTAGIPTRMGSDFTDYYNSLDTKTPTADYRLVRFFDVFTEPGKTYEYRMRAWLGDPNNEDPNNEFVNNQGGTTIRSNFGGDDMMEGEDDFDSGDEEEDYGGESRNRGGSNVGQEEEAVAQYVSISSKMLHPSVRQRVNRQKEVTDPKTGEVSYVVAEYRGQDQDGKDIYEEIPVPKAPVGKDFAGTIYSNYLKHARPTDWSDPVKITIRPKRAKVAGGQVSQPRMVTLSRTADAITQFPIGEPQAKVAASVWWKKELGTALPTLQTVSRGDALDFYTPAYFLHPVTWEVLVAKNLDVTEGEAQYVVPIETGNVVVDLMGGEEIPLPRAEKMRHNLASELLVMDEYGEFSIKNDMRDRTAYRNMLFLPDESQTVGRKKAKKKKALDAPEGEGGFGRGGGGGEGEDEGFF